MSLSVSSTAQAQVTPAQAIAAMNAVKPEQERYVMSGKAVFLRIKTLQTNADTQWKRIGANAIFFNVVDLLNAALKMQEITNIKGLALQETDYAEDEHIAAIAFFRHGITAAGMKNWAEVKSRGDASKQTYIQGQAFNTSANGYLDEMAAKITAFKQWIDQKTTI